MKKFNFLVKNFEIERKSPKKFIKTHKTLWITTENMHKQPFAHLSRFQF